MWLLLTTMSWAHPAGGALPGHRLDLLIGPRGLELHQWTRVPVHHLLETLEPSADFGPDAADAFMERTQQDFMQGLVVKVDGQVQDWTLVPGSRSSHGDDTFLFVEQDLTLPLTAGPHLLELRNENLAALPGFFFYEVMLDPTWVVLDSDLLVQRDGKIAGDLTEIWSLDEALRELSVQLRPAGPVESLMRQDQALTLFQALPPSVPRDWWVLGGVGLLLGLGAGVMARRGRR